MAPARHPSRAVRRAQTLPRVKPERKTNCSELSDRPLEPWIIQPPMNEPNAWLAKIVICSQPRTISRRWSRGGRAGTVMLMFAARRPLS